MATGSALASHSARSWLTSWIEEKKVSISPRSRLKYEQIVREFLAHLKQKASDGAAWKRTKFGVLLIC